jgi:uncharacterized protein (DUF608 family)
MTAVEWLLTKIPFDVSLELIKKGITKEAKEMEKQQIIDAYRRSTYQFEVDAKINCRTAEEYYNETFINK